MRRLLAFSAFVAATAGIGTAADATIFVFNTLAGFNAATNNPGVDTFQSLSITGLTASPITRTAGSYGYTAAAAGGFYGAGPAGDHWLSTNLATDSITLSAFTGGVRGAGGLFFGSDINGNFIAVPSISLVATDASGSVTGTITNPTTTSFIGFVSTSGLLSLTINSPTVDTVNGPFYFPTANNLVLAGPIAAAVPEPLSWTMMAVGFGVAGAALRRTRAARTAAI